MNQYFENNDNLNHKIVDLKLSLNGVELNLKSDRGVFSAYEIDEGSLILLKAIKEEQIEGNILDVGCGYGTLGLYLAKKYSSAFVEMFDVNVRAVELVKTNIKLNNITNASSYVGDNYQALQKKKYNLIVINPPIRAGKSVYYPLLSEASNYITDGGKLMFVIRKSHGALSAQKYLLAYFKEVVMVYREKGFYVYSATR